MVDDPRRLRGGPTETAVATRRVVWIEDAAHDPSTWGGRPYVKEEGVVSLLSIPLETSAAVLGALTVYRRTPGCWSNREIRLLQFFADHAATSLQTARLLSEREERLVALTRLTRSLGDQAHEHANRLHAIHGLLAIGEPDEAQAFISEVLRAGTLARSGTVSGIGRPALAGFLIAEQSIAAQREIEFVVTPDSRLERLPETLSDSKLITIVGNLVDNACDAVADMEDSRRRVELRVHEGTRRLVIAVRDHGAGLKQPRERAVRHGTSTKPGHMGAGLALVDSLVRESLGEMRSLAHADGTTFEVTLPMTADLDFPQAPTSQLARADRCHRNGRCR